MYKVFKSPPFNVYYREGTADEKVIEQSFGHDLFYRVLPELNFGETPVIVDLGAHIGTFSMLTSSRLPNSVTYAIEAGAESFDVLKNNIEGNKITNVKIFQVALADKDGEACLYHSQEKENWGFSITKDLGGIGETVSTVSLDSFMKLNSIEHVDFIKSNCEGAEFGIFINAPDEALRRIKAGLILYHGDLQETFSVDQLIEKFRRNNFITEVFNKTSRRGWLLVKSREFYERSSFASLLRTKYIFKIREKLEL